MQENCFVKKMKTKEFPETLNTAVVGKDFYTKTESSDHEDHITNDSVQPKVNSTIRRTTLTG
jgi:hypothetical protein